MVDCRVFSFLNREQHKKQHSPSGLGRGLSGQQMAHAQHSSLSQPTQQGDGANTTTEALVDRLTQVHVSEDTEKKAFTYNERKRLPTVTMIGDEGTP